MSFHYQTEYRMGSRGRVCRTYRGIQALNAIAFDLTLGLLFGFFGFGYRLVRCLVLTAWWVAVALWRVTVALVKLPLRVARTIAAPGPRRTVVKPAWATFDEL